MANFNIELGTLISYTGKNPGGKSLNDVRRGIIVTSKRERETVILKPGIDTSELTREFFSACIASFLSLPVPSQYLVLDHSTDTIMYACGFLDYPNLYQSFLESDQKKEVLMLLYRWQKFNEVATFDELIQNVDRHIGNLLWGGSDKFVLIDHGLTFGHYAIPQNTSRNRLLEEFLPQIIPSSQINREIIKCQEIATQYPSQLGKDSLKSLLENNLGELSKIIEEQAKLLLSILTMVQSGISSRLSDRAPALPLFTQVQK